VLQPGTYTGLLVVSGTASLQLLPGVYNLQRGLTVSGGGRVTGKGVLLYLGPSGGLSITSGGRVSLSAPASGPDQGVALWQDRGTSGPVVIDGGTLNLTGSLYAAGAPVMVLNGGTVKLKGDVSRGLDAQLVALDLLLASGLVTVDASANPFAAL
jgi:hypothetical protein